MLRSHRNRTVVNSAGCLIPHLRPGVRVLDVGAGPGTITCDLADRVRSADGRGLVVAVEHDAEALQHTRDEVARQAATNVAFAVADIHHLVMPETLQGTGFDIVHAHQVLQHVADPVGALRQLARACAPGGVVATRDSDYGGFRWYPNIPALDDWLQLYRRLALDTGGEPDAGLHYRAWARAAGLTDVSITLCSWCYADAETTAWWGGLWTDRALHSEFADRALALDISRAQLQRIADGWRTWAGDPEAMFTVPSTELLARIP